MSPRRQGNLSNTKREVLFDATLAFILTEPYKQQLERIAAQGSTTGISPFFILGNVVLSHSQLSQALLLAAYVYPGDGPHQPVLQQIADGSLRGWRALGAVFGLLHLAMRWGYAVVLVVLYSIYYPRHGWTLNIVNGIASTWAAVFLLPVVYLTPLRRPTHNRDMGSDVIIGLTSIVSQYTAPGIMILQFTSQLLEFRHADGKLGALSRHSLFTQALVYFFMGLRWRRRVGKAGWEEDERPAHPPLWYRLEMLWMRCQWGMVWMNQLFYAGGCLVLWVSAMLKYM